MLGTVISIDLCTANFQSSPYRRRMAETFLGGRGFNVAHLHRHLPTGIDALAPENILVLSCGLLTGTAVPTATRLHLNALSPLTGILGSSNVGGHIGAWLRSCDVQSLIIQGKSPQPVYLLINSSGARLLDATSLWTMDTRQTQSALRQKHGNRIKILTIGPAGETVCRFACVITDKDHAAGRTGMGAVMGAKNLKAVVVDRGNCKHPPADARLLKKAVQRYITDVRESADYDTFSRLGGAGYVTWAHEKKLMSAHNYHARQFDGSHRIDGRQLAPYISAKTGCFGCPIQCKADLAFAEGRLQGKTATRPEFEPMINLGARCGLADLQELIYLDNLCTRLGMDSTSAAAAIAFAMDLFEHDILSRNDADGLSLRWGDARAMQRLIRLMAAGTGIGAVLSQGVRRAAQLIGNGAEKFAPHVKGLELTAYHPCAVMGTALGYAVSSRGGDYNNVYASLEQRWTPQQAMRAFGTPEAVNERSCAGKAALVKRAVLVNIVADSLGLCKVPTLSLVGAFDLRHEAALTSAYTGWPVSPADLFQAGQRIADIERLFNISHGLQPSDDMLPSMFFDSTRADNLNREQVEKMVAEFYDVMGWDLRGVPEQMSLIGHERRNANSIVIGQ